MHYNTKETSCTESQPNTAKTRYTRQSPLVHSQSRDYDCLGKTIIYIYFFNSEKANKKAKMKQQKTKPRERGEQGGLGFQTNNLTENK